jgi:hydroxyacylglutathione hydrolase
MVVHRFKADGVSDQSYLVVDKAGGVAAVFDAQRDIWSYLEKAGQLGVKITHAFDTHVHNDFVSGSRALHEVAGVVVVQAADSGITYPCHQVRDTDRVQVGSFAVQALHTPGHTFHHMSYLLEEENKPIAVFTGGSLLVETVGRTDLVSVGATEELARAQRASILRLSNLPDDTDVFPTHGAGSFCAAGEPPDRDTTSIGREKRDNLAMKIAMSSDENAFVRHALHSLPSYPAYYAHMAPLNRAGTPALLSLPIMEPIDPRKAYELQKSGRILVDARKAAEFVKAFPMGARNIPLGDTFAGYVGWVLPFNAEIVFVLARDDDWKRARGQLIRIGYDRADAFVQGGFPAWQAAGLPVDHLQSISIAELRAMDKSRTVTVVDVRQDTEWSAGHLPNAVHVPLGSLPARLGDVPADGGTIVTMCAGGTRATIGASILRRVGFEPLVVTDGGYGEWAARNWPVIKP